MVQTEGAAQRAQKRESRRCAHIVPPLKIEAAKVSRREQRDEGEVIGERRART